jgi:hypothetical protein
MREWLDLLGDELFVRLMVSVSLNYLWQLWGRSSLSSADNFLGLRRIRYYGSDTLCPK